MTALDAAALARLAQQLNIDPEEVAARLAPAPTPSISAGEHLHGFLPKLTRNTRRTYRTHLVRFVYGFGPVCDQACEPCLDPKHSFVCRCSCGPCRTSRIALPDISDQPVSPAIYNRAAVEAVKIVARRVAVRRGIYENRRRAERGRPKKAADGIGAQETAVTAMRALCQSVPILIDGYDGLDVPKPHRSGRERRPLQDHELLELSHLTGTGGNDPELDLLLFDFGLETGARRSGAYGLTVAQIRPQSQIIKVKDKYGREQDAPVSERLIRRLLTHAISRGGPECDPASPDYRPDSPVFYYRTRTGGHEPITSRRFDTLHERWQKELDWAAEEQVAYHHIRHTMSHILKTHYGPQYAKRYLRHSKGDVTDTYGACSTEELARALSELFEYEHPLVQGMQDRRAQTLKRFGLS